MLLTVRQGSGVNEHEGDAEGLQEDLLAVLKVGLIIICCEQIFYIAQSTVPSSHDVPLIVDLSDSEPICLYTPFNLLFRSDQRALKLTRALYFGQVEHSSRNVLRSSCL